MREAKIIVDMIQGELLPQAVLALAQRIDTPPNRGDMLAEAEVEAFHKRRIDLPAAGRQHLLDRLQRVLSQSCFFESWGVCKSLNS